MNSRSPIRPFVKLGLVLLAFWFGPAGRAAAQVLYRTVALSGQPAPGAPEGVNYSGFDATTLNDNGQIAYVAGLTGSGVTDANNQSIYAGPLAAPQLVARSGDAAPGTPAGVNYRSLFNTPVLNDAGQVAYRADLTGSGVTTANDGAIYAGSLAAPQLVARTGNAAPGTPAGVNYAGFSSGPALNDAGQTAYLANLTGSGVTSANDVAIYAGPLAAPQLVAREGGRAPGTLAGVNYQSLLNTPVLNDAGQVAYQTSLAGSGVTRANDVALYAGPLAAPQLVARTGNAAPGTPAGVNYAGIGEPALNDAGQAAYVARVIGSGVTDPNSTAMYTGPLATPQLVAREGAAAPGVPAGAIYAGFIEPAFNDAGLLAFRAGLKGSGVTTANDGVIYAGSPAAPQIVAREGDHAPGTPTGVNYSDFFFTPALNDAGQSAYIADLAGSGVTLANDRGLFASDPALGGLLIAREGDLFDIGGGDFRTIANIGIDFLAGRSDDEPTGLSNDGTLAFRLSFTDGASGIFTATIVPEPGALALLALAGLMLVGCRSTLRRRML